MLEETRYLFAQADELAEQERYAEAFALFLKLAEAGDIASMNRVAVMYGEGQGVTYDFAQSVEWDTKAAERGDTLALLNLGASYRRAGDMRHAKSWYEQALAAGESEAALELAKMYLVSELETERVRNYLRQALAGADLCEESREAAEILLAELNI